MLNWAEKYAERIREGHGNSWNIDDGTLYLELVGLIWEIRADVLEEAAQEAEKQKCYDVAGAIRTLRY